MNRYCCLNNARASNMINISNLRGNSIVDIEMCGQILVRGKKLLPRGLCDIIIIEKVISTTTGGRTLTPDEVCEALVKIGADVSRQTLLNYEDAGLIPAPERGGGRKGRFTNYPEWTIEEAFVAWRFIHGKYGDVINSPFEGATPRMAPAAIRRIRERYYSGRSEDSRTSEDAKETYLLLSGQMDCQHLFGQIL